MQRSGSWTRWINRSARDLTARVSRASNSMLSSRRSGRSNSSRGGDGEGSARSCRSSEDEEEGVEEEEAADARAVAAVAARQLPVKLPKRVSWAAALGSFRSSRRSARRGRRGEAEEVLGTAERREEAGKPLTPAVSSQALPIAPPPAVIDVGGDAARLAAFASRAAAFAPGSTITPDTTGDAYRLAAMLSAEPAKHRHPPPQPPLPLRGRRWLARLELV